MVNLVKHDLEFILKQIEIAERHAAGEDLRELVAEAGGLDPNSPTTPTQAHLLPYGLRTVDGTYNNLVEGRETWGAADQPFPVLTPPQYVNEGDDSMMFGTPANPVWLTNGNYTPGSSTGSPMLPPGTVVDADPRLISNLIADQTLGNPAAIGAALTYAGITGAAQITAIQQIQAARAAITDAIADAGTAVGAIPGLQTAVGTAGAALAGLLRTRPRMQRPRRNSRPPSRPSTTRRPCSTPSTARRRPLPLTSLPSRTPWTRARLPWTLRLRRLSYRLRRSRTPRMP
jgi:hypothetical protein